LISANRTTASSRSAPGERSPGGKNPVIYGALLSERVFPIKPKYSSGMVRSSCGDIYPIGLEMVAISDQRKDWEIRKEIICEFSLHCDSLLNSEDKQISESLGQSDHEQRQEYPAQNVLH
jgi:hypothetical protein